MGARTVFEVKDRNGSIFLYSHWGGDTKREDAIHALTQAKPRWGINDTTYAMRIFISQIVGDAWNDETGYGISAKHTFEEQFQPMVIDFEDNLVEYNNEVVSFKEFIGDHI
jgi:hypothetical protein